MAWWGRRLGLAVLGIVDAGLDNKVDGNGGAMAKGCPKVGVCQCLKGGMSMFKINKIKVGCLRFSRLMWFSNFTFLFRNYIDIHIY